MSRRLPVLLGLIATSVLAQPAPETPSSEAAEQVAPPAEAPAPTQPSPETADSSPKAAGDTLRRQAPREVERLERLVPDEAKKSYDEVAFIAAEARSFFANMLAGDARSLVHAAGFPFYLDDHRVQKPEELLQELLKHLRSKRTDLLDLYGVELLTPVEMEKKFGRPPPRLANFPWRTPRTYIAIANISGRGAIAVFREVTVGNWRVVAYHD